MTKSKIKELIKQININLGRKLRTLRHMRALTQAEMGKRLEVSFQQIQKYERGVNRISAASLFCILNEFDVKIEDFMDIDKHAQEPEFVVPDKEVVFMVKSYKKIKNPRVRKIMRETLDDMVKNDAKLTNLNNEE